MKKRYKLQDLDCAACAAKIEEGVKKIEGVSDASVSFIASELILECEEQNLEAILKKAAKIVKKTEPDCRIIL